MSSFFNKAKEALNSAGGSKPQQQTTAPGVDGQPAQNVQKDDYVDKGFGAVSKKFGLNTSKESNERITDAGRDFYEKQTGKKVSDKISN